MINHRQRVRRHIYHPAPAVADRRRADFGEGAGEAVAYLCQFACVGPGVEDAAGLKRAGGRDVETSRGAPCVGVSLRRGRPEPGAGGVGQELRQEGQQMAKGCRADVELVPRPGRKRIAAVAAPADCEAVVSRSAGQQLGQGPGDADAGGHRKLRQADAMRAKEQRRPCARGEDHPCAAHMADFGLDPGNPSG